VVAPAPAAAASVDDDAELARPFRDCAEILACPISGGRLVPSKRGFVAADGRTYAVRAGIPDLSAPVEAAPRDVTAAVKAFYEATPFPNYETGDTRDTLLAKARRSYFLRALDEQLPPDAVVLEAGCGTGQLTNFLALDPRRRVFGGDLCRNSLRLAEDFRRRQGIDNAAFLQMNLFRPPFRPGSVDVLISNGVLHHTADARGGFEALLRVVKPGGLVLLGLYNRYARLPTLGRRWVFKRSGALHFLDRRLAGGRLDEAQRQAWFRDQYQHPHETRHSMDEVLRWFDDAGVAFLSSIPPADGRAFTAAARLFDLQPRGSGVRRLAVQLGMLARGGADGGLFIMIGRKQGQ